MKTLKQIITEGLLRNIGVGTTAIINKWIDNKNNTFASEENIFYSVDDNGYINIGDYMYEFFKGSETDKPIQVPDYIKIGSIKVEKSATSYHYDYSYIQSDNWAELLPKTIKAKNVVFDLKLNNSNISEGDLQYIINPINKSHCYVEGINLTGCENIKSFRGVPTINLWGVIDISLINMPNITSLEDLDFNVRGGNQCKLHIRNCPKFEETKNSSLDVEILDIQNTKLSDELIKYIDSNLSKLKSRDRNTTTEQALLFNNELLEKCPAFMKLVYGFNSIETINLYRNSSPKPSFSLTHKKIKDSADTYVYELKRLK